MCMLALVVVSFAVLAAFVMREHAADEREVYHRMLAGRAAFICGTAIIILGISIQTLNHAVDVWLVVALVGMILSKFGARLYSDRVL